MRIRLLCVGRPGDREAVALHDRYAQRVERLGWDYAAEWVSQVKAGGRYSDEHVREREARLLLGKIGPKEAVIALDPSGEMLTSDSLATRLQRWAGQGATLVLGGPLGLHRTVLDRADCCWSLSTLTLPHELARVLVIEQVYRGLTLLRGVPYHK